jgi:hypothetical protein
MVYDTVYECLQILRNIFFVFLGRLSYKFPKYTEHVTYI